MGPLLPVRAGKHQPALAFAGKGVTKEEGERNYAWRERITTLKKRPFRSEKKGGLPPKPKRKTGMVRCGEGGQKWKTTRPNTKEQQLRNTTVLGQRSLATLNRYETKEKKVGNLREPTQKKHRRSERRADSSQLPLGGESSVSRGTGKVPPLGGPNLRLVVKNEPGPDHFSEKRSKRANVTSKPMGVVRPLAKPCWSPKRGPKGLGDNKPSNPLA